MVIENTVALPESSGCDMQSVLQHLNTLGENQNRHMRDIGTDLLTRMNQIVEQHQCQMEGMKQEMATMQESHIQKMNDMKQEMATMQENHKQEMSALMTGHEKQIQKLQQIIAKLQDQLVRKDEDILKLRQSVDKLCERVEGKDKEIAELKKELSRLKADANRGVFDKLLKKIKEIFG